MGREDIESRVERILSQASPAETKKQVRPIFLIILILVLIAPLAMSQVPQELKHNTDYTYPVPPYQTQVQPAIMQNAERPIYVQPIKQTFVGCSFFKSVKSVPQTVSDTENI